MTTSGYPLRLLLPRFEGNTHIKWLRRLEVSDQPFMTREETSKYTDLMPDGSARQFSMEMEAKSVITFPSGAIRITGTFAFRMSSVVRRSRKFGFVWAIFQFPASQEDRRDVNWPPF
ncbi:molybdopterin-dependent oxidoreductase [Palleronia aestuarii]|uniref:molybdopterin-dependent oxidoreductase n=1 Tax=Palleronia aestuarii TaxID=568105 RepID=UPI0035711C60